MLRPKQPASVTWLLQEAVWSSSLSISSPLLSPFHCQGLEILFPHDKTPYKGCADIKIWCYISRRGAGAPSTLPHCTPLTLKSDSSVCRHPTTHPPGRRSPRQVWAQHHHSALQLAAVKTAQRSLSSYFHRVLLMTGLMALTAHWPDSLMLKPAARGQEEEEEEVALTTRDLRSDAFPQPPVPRWRRID